VFLSLEFYPHSEYENLVPLQNLNTSLVFVHHEYSLLFAQGYPVKHKFSVLHHLHEEASEQYTLTTT
jgi:hypothetical protein